MQKGTGDAGMKYMLKELSMKYKQCAGKLLLALALLAGSLSLVGLWTSHAHAAASAKHFKRPYEDKCAGAILVREKNEKIHCQPAHSTASYPNADLICNHTGGSIQVISAGWTGGINPKDCYGLPFSIPNPTIRQDPLVPKSPSLL
jgi:hypothetical protein